MDSIKEKTSETTDRVGPYRLGVLLGTGGMGAVYRGFHELLERHVALKRIHSEKPITEEARGRFLREAQAAARLNHPAVVQVYDIFEHDGDDWIAMEFVEGVTLSESIRRHPMPWQRVLEVARSVVSGLDAAHAAAIIHRDLKTENVILAENGQVKILDFGLAQDVSSRSLQGAGTRLRNLVGTPRAMSPEQATGRPLDYRSDLFSLGVLIYETLTGISPFTAPSVGATLRRVRTKKQRPVIELEGSVPIALSQLVDQLLAKEPRHRPATARAVIELLDGIDSPPTGESRHPLRRVPGDGLPLAVTDHASRSAPTVTMEIATAVPAGLDERRHVIVLSCELSTEDPEDLYEVLPALQERVRSLVDNDRGCFIETPDARLVICLGYPIAFEDDARHAVVLGRTVLSEIDSLARRRGIEGLEPRMGLHTGVALVPAGSSSGSGMLKLGATLDRAVAVARQAGAGQLLASAAALPLISNQFATEPQDPAPDSGTGLSVVLESPVDAGSDTDVPVDGQAPSIGRDNELRLLADAFAAAREGGCQVVQVCGEAGIGKTRLLAELRHRLDPESRVWVDLSGSEETANSPLYPIPSLLRSCVGGARDDTPEEQIQSLKAQAEELESEAEDYVPYIAPLLSPSLEEKYPLPALAPETLKQRTFEALAWLLATADDRPIVLACEDLHWLDPSTVEWIELLIKKRHVPRLLILLTFRPEFVPPWGHRPDIIQLNLNPLSRDLTYRLIDQVAGGARLPPAVIEHIVSRTDGIPLFLEQLTKTVLESGQDPRDAGSTPLPASIPKTLRGSLTARLDRLGLARSVAQYASVVGREFSLPILKALSPLDESVLESELEHLVEAGIIYRRGFGGAARFTFKHALIRDTAYDSLLKKDRKKLHRQIAGVLMESSSRRVQASPELVARHCTAGGLKEEAIDYWTRAGRKALERSANIEAIAHFEQGLEVLRALPESTANSRREIELRAPLSRALTAAKGFAEPELERNLLRTRELAERVEDTARLTDTLRDLFRGASYAGQSESMLDYATRFLAHAQALEGDGLTMEARFISGITRFYRGELEQARRQLEGSLRAEGRWLAEHRDARGEKDWRDTGVPARSFLAIDLWLSGYPDQARARNREALALARGSNPLSRASAEVNAAAFFLLAGEHQEARERARAAIELSEEKELFTSLWARASLGLTSLLGGSEPGKDDELEVGLEETHETVEAIRSTGARFSLAQLYCDLAHAYLRHGRPDDAESCLQQAETLIEAHGERVWLPEASRLLGELQIARGHDDRAEDRLLQAIEVARDQGSRSFELRTALSLHRLWSRLGQGEKARSVLATVFETFAEGFSSPDLVTAGRLLSPDSA